MSGTIVQQGYEASVGGRALARAIGSGNNPAQSVAKVKGIAHEIMFCDKINTQPSNIVNGIHANLTHSATARMKDMVVQNADGKILHHMQLKDTVSNSGIRKTTQQVLKGHYNKTSIYGTEETTTAVNKALEATGKHVQKVKSTGISSKATGRIASKAVGKTPSLSVCGAAAKAGGATGAAIGAGIEAVTSIYDVINGDKDVGDAVFDIAGAGIRGGITGAGSAFASTAAAGATGTAIGIATSTAVGSAIAGTAIGGMAIAAAPIAAAFGAAFVVGDFISSLFD